ncbi:uncharacterized protein LOC142233639 [Haematobia irritans]|uniref:uncharacterized protein LOC142233639 n=1 Tax=Haematobia irritans TaxID=7368 RepID=UPI003F50C3D4
MFDTITSIPTILAYIFISLLVTILGFIVIYVSHKIYVTIYDNLPVAQISSSSPIKITEKIKTISQPSALVCGPMQGRKSKTALRITIILEPCYLAYIIFNIRYSLPLWSSSKHPSLNCLEFSNANFTKSWTWNGHNDPKYLIIFFDNLSAIPTTRYIQRRLSHDIANK